jgi:hypothetical protein
MEENSGLRKGSSALNGSQSSSKARPSSQPNNPTGRERVSFLLDASDRRKSSSFRGMGDTAMDTKASILTKGFCCLSMSQIAIKMTLFPWRHLGRDWDFEPPSFLKSPFLFDFPKLSLFAIYSGYPSDTLGRRDTSYRIEKSMISKSQMRQYYTPPLPWLIRTPSKVNKHATAMLKRT